MARKIRFPLKMQNGADVRTIEELRENFDLESVLGYYANGKLATWLSDRYYDAEAEKVKSIDPNSKDFNKQICEIIGVECVEESTETDLEAIKLRNERIATLRQVTDDEEIIKNVDSVAFDQDELFDLLDDDTDVIYLFGDKFSVPLGKGNVKYIGVNNPLVLLDVDNLQSYECNSIIFENVKFEKHIQKKDDEPSLSLFDKFEQWICKNVNSYSEITKHIKSSYTITDKKIYFFDNNDNLCSCNHDLSNIQLITDKLWIPNFGDAEAKHGQVLGHTENFVFVFSNHSYSININDNYIQEIHGGSHYIKLCNVDKDSIICFNNKPPYTPFSHCYDLVEVNLKNVCSSKISIGPVLTHFVYNNNLYHVVVEWSESYPQNASTLYNSSDYWKKYCSYYMHSQRKTIYDLSSPYVRDFNITLYRYDLEFEELKMVKKIDSFSISNHAKPIKGELNIDNIKNNEFTLKITCGEYDQLTLYKKKYIINF